MHRFRFPAIATALLLTAAACDHAPTSPLAPGLEVYSMGEGRRLEVSRAPNHIKVIHYDGDQLVAEARFTDARNGKATVYLDGRKTNIRLVNGVAEPDRGNVSAYLGDYIPDFGSSGPSCCEEKRREYYFAVAEYLLAVAVMAYACSPADAYIMCGTSMGAVITTWGRLVYAMHAYSQCVSSGCATSFMRPDPIYAQHARRYV